MPLTLYFAPSLNLNPGAADGAEIVSEGAAATAGCWAASAAATGATASAVGATGLMPAGVAGTGGVATTAAASCGAWPEARTLPEKDQTVARHAKNEMFRSEM